MGDPDETSAGQGPLRGLRVLDIATIVSAPFAASLLGDYGAEVLKVELPSGDGARGFPPFKDGKSLWWKVTNRNKKFVTLDLRKPEGIAILKQLLPKFDVLVENFRPGTLDRWGLTKEVLWSLQPRLVILRATGFGQTGPYRDRPGFARIFEAMGGLTYITGEPGGEPMHAGYPIGDAIGGVFGALGIVFLVLFTWRERTTDDPMLDLSLLTLSTVRNANLAGFAVGGAMFGTLILLPFYFSTVLGYSGIELSLASTPVAACFMIGAPTSGRLMSMVGSDVVVRFAVGTAVAGAIALALGAMTQSYVWMLPGLILTGLGLSSATSPVTTTAIHEAPHDRIGVAAALPNVARYSGGALGGALLGTVLAMSLPASVTADSRLLPLAVREQVAQGMRAALFTAAGILLLGLVAAWRMPRVIGPGARIVAMIPGTGEHPPRPRD